MVNLVTGKEDELLKRLSSEGKTPPDVLITTDAGCLYRAKRRGFATCKDDSLNQAIPDQLRDPEGYWFWFVRSCTGDRHVKGRCSRRSCPPMKTWPILNGRAHLHSLLRQHLQPILVASLIDRNGKEATEQWAKGWWPFGTNSKRRGPGSGDCRGRRAM